MDYWSRNKCTDSGIGIVAGWEKVNSFTWKGINLDESNWIDCCSPEKICSPVIVGATTTAEGRGKTQDDKGFEYGAVFTSFLLYDNSLQTCLRCSIPIDSRRIQFGMSAAKQEEANKRYKELHVGSSDHVASEGRGWEWCNGRRSGYWRYNFFAEDMIQELKFILFISTVCSLGLVGYHDSYHFAIESVCIANSSNQQESFRT